MFLIPLECFRQPGCPLPGIDKHSAPGNDVKQCPSLSPSSKATRPLAIPR